MNFLLSRSARLGFGLIAASALGATPADPIPPVPSITQQIDTLLKRRLKPEPLPSDLPNPFVMSAKDLKDSITVSSAANPDSASGETADAKPIANTDVLAVAITRLRFGGVIRLKDQIQVVINDTPRKEGDVLKMPWINGQISIRVQHISPSDVVLRYLDIDATVRF